MPKSSSEYRLSYYEAREVLDRRLAEPAPGRIQILVGPRQVGKTTLLLELAGSMGDRAVYAAGDAPEAALPGFWERFVGRVEEAAGAGPVVAILDEVQSVNDWAARLKGQWDAWKRTGVPVHLVASGSSSLLLGSGARESLTGRFEKLTISHWAASSIVRAFGVSEREAADLVVTLGSYPGAFSLRPDWPRWRAYVRDAILEPAIGRDILALAPVRKPALLRQVFGVCTGSPAQVVSLQKIQGQLQDAGALETIGHYLQLLEEAFLVAALPKFSHRTARRRSSPPKLVVLNNALLAAVDPQGPPSQNAQPERFGAWVENACLAFAWNSGQTVCYWREEPWEVDAVIEGSWGRWAIEVKTGSYSPADLRGVGEFTRRYPGFRPLVLCDGSQLATARRAGMPAMSWTDYLVSGPAGPAAAT